MLGKPSGARIDGTRPGGEPSSSTDLSLLNERAVTLILYLNGPPSEWDVATVGGGLRIHHSARQEDDEALFGGGWEGGVAGAGAAGPFVDVPPLAGNVVAFRSELLHEVLPTVDGRLRLALSMWCVCPDQQVEVQ